jgi:hypothetical protein
MNAEDLLVERQFSTAPRTRFGTAGFDDPALSPTIPAGGG